MRLGSKMMNNTSKQPVNHLRAIRETLARHREMPAQMPERLGTLEARSAERDTTEARSSGSETGQDEESGELP
jgi:hypothetical protein